MSRAGRRYPDGFVLRGGTVVDPVSRTMYEGDVLVVMSDPPHLEVARAGAMPRSRERAIDAGGLVIAPGFLDLHVHFRTPGQEHKETIATGSRAAAAGGFCTVVCEPNTDPPIDSEGKVRAVLDRAAAESVVNLYQKMAVTTGQRGEEMSDFRSAKSAVAFSDDGEPILSDEVMRKALRLAATVRKPLMVHDEASPRSMARLRRRYPSAKAYEYEPKLVRRDLRLVEETGCPLHFSHISMAQSLAMIRRAKARGLPVTCEVTPHHAWLCRLCEEPPRRNTNWKTNPPIRLGEHVVAVDKALRDGTVDAVATDHAPHSRQEKALPYAKAPFGVIGLETAVGALLADVRDDLILLVRLLTTGPARLWPRRPGMGEALRAREPDRH